jgi:thiosulfate dehydrogenase
LLFINGLIEYNHVGESTVDWKSMDNNNWYLRLLVRPILPLLILGGLFLFIVYNHAVTEDKLSAEVVLEPDCEELLMNRLKIQEDGFDGYYIRAVQRGCNIFSNPQKHAGRFVRANIRCKDCHLELGMKGETAPIGQGWVQSDKYDPVTGIIVSYELRTMQCFINSSNGFKPNILDSVIQDLKIYGRYLAFKQGLREGIEYPERRFTKVPPSGEGDDFVRGKHLYEQKCAMCHGKQGLGVVADDGSVIFPALAGPRAWNTDSRMYNEAITLAAIIKTTMPAHERNTLTDTQARDIAAYLVTIPRPAGNRKGVVAAARQQLIMRTMPPLFSLIERWKAEDEAQ